MKKLLTLFVLIPFLVTGLSGCIPVFLMAVGGVGVYAVSKDTIQGDTDTPYEAIWDSALKVARIRGTVLQEDFNRGYIEVNAKPNKIWIQFVRVTTTATKIRVSARKYKLPNIDLAQEVFIKIIEEANKGS
ncbi:MAG: hypothetical protein NTY14_06020 [Candidatus Omnitrophica bacterium]|nr:hypothetical protein [Candidatus Omnitrophota bacterium]